MMDTKTTINHLKIMLGKFEDLSSLNDSAIPEFKAAQEILEIINTPKVISSSEKIKIKEIIKTTEQTDHFNGSLWFDFKLHVKYITEERSTK